MDRFLHWIGALDAEQRLVLVKSWRPHWDHKYRCICWPVMLVDRGWVDRQGKFRAFSRETTSPLWDRCRILVRLGRKCR